MYHGTTIVLCVHGGLSPLQDLQSAQNARLELLPIIVLTYAPSVLETLFPVTGQIFVFPALEAL
jgi:hypothetical protein